MALENWNVFKKIGGWMDGASRYYSTMAHPFIEVTQLFPKWEILSKKEDTQRSVDSTTAFKKTNSAEWEQDFNKES